jgi:MFS transporter, YNFM family, putative membrane transport protein
LPTGHLLIIQYCTVLVMAALYAPQPLLPVLATAFDVSEARASLLITVTLLPLAVAPIAYGFLLQRVSARRLLMVSIWVLAGSQAGIYFAAHFDLLLLLRLVQGLAIPAMLTGLMTYLGASAGPGRIARVMAVYVASTVMGGFLGRALSGMISATFGWRWSFMAFALATVLGALLLRRLKSDPAVSFQRFRLVRRWMFCASRSSCASTGSCSAPSGPLPRCSISCLSASWNWVRGSASGASA